MDKLPLKDGTKIEMVAGASLRSALQIESESRETMLEIWKKLTDENLKSIRIETSDGLTVGNSEDVLLVSETSAVEGGKVKTSFNMRERTSEEKRLDAFKKSRRSRMRRSSDLGAAASELAEKGGASDGGFLWKEIERRENDT
ncbi:MAG: hypothetical protein V8R18_02440 [Clostridium sp.]